jgi:hypothetical protein
MSFDPYFITSYLHQNFLIPPNSVKLSSNLKVDFRLNQSEIYDFLTYLNGIFDVKFPLKKSDDRYEYLFEIIFYIVIYQYENSLLQVK